MASPSHAKLNGFDVIQTTYKQIQDHSIRADILVPHTPFAGKRPVVIRFHGGGLVMGDSLFMDFWPHWLSDMALIYNAVILSPNYRLMPEATSPQIHDDMEDFWTWVHSPALKDLLAAHSTPAKIDLSRIITAGDSAGGLLSLNLALAHPSEIHAATASYPWVTPSGEKDSTPKVNPPFGQHTPESVYNDALATMKIETPVSLVITPVSL